MDAKSREVSLKLFDVLERVGVSEKIRKLRRDTFIRHEIQETAALYMTDSPWSIYRLGSSIEGTTTRGMDSDVDILHCHEFRRVIENIEEVTDYHISPTNVRLEEEDGTLLIFTGQTRSPEISLLTVTDFHTKPGYVKLQAVYNETPLTKHNCTTDDSRVTYDTMGRLCFKHKILQTVNSERNGPADTVNGPGTVETDWVYAVRSTTFPYVALESLVECQESGWLTMDDVDNLYHYGCLYVGVGHPLSQDKDYEWRISFSLQERELMFRLNPTQHKCYFLLKCIKSMLTSEPDIGKSITSYHCKTCLFRVINRTQKEQWTPEHLIYCTIECLNELLQCVCNGDCPNFFIKANNMFERRVYGEVKDRLIHYLQDMLDEGFNLFYRIPLDNIGEALRGHVNSNTNIERNLCRLTCDIYRFSCYIQVQFNLYIGKWVNEYTREATGRYLCEQLSRLSTVDRITEHTQDETREAIRDIELILHRLYAAYLASLAFSTDSQESKHRLLQDSASHLKQAMTCDLMSGRLLYASILYTQGNIDMCCNLLERLEQKIHKTVQTLCECSGVQYLYSTEDGQDLLSRNSDPQSMMESSVAACMIFLPYHSEIIPTALQYEMYRSVATPSGSRKKGVDDWLDLVTVDSKVYLYFLQYLVYSRLNRIGARRLAAANIFKQLHYDDNLGHSDTAYNLLGWILGQEGQIENAADCFYLSWMIRPQHNAAKWHMLILMYQQYVARQ